MNSFDFISALGDADQRIVLDALEFVRAEEEYDPQKEEVTMNSSIPRFRHRRIGKTFLIAAAITALFAAMCVGAYALNLFGLRDLLMTESRHEETVMNGDLTVDVTYMSLAGSPETPEYNASLEWLTWVRSYMDSQPEGWINNSWEPADESLADSAVIYPCFDNNMVAKLKEISEKYDLKLHTLTITPQGMNDLYELAGTEEFIASDSLVTIPKYIFEDGSFVLEGSYADGTFSFLRNNAGTLPSMQVNVWNADEYEEASYTNRSGDMVCIAFNRTLGTAHILYNSGNAYIDLTAQVRNRADAEALADCFRFSDAAAGVPRVADKLNATPHTVKADGAVTLSDFAESPEYKGLWEFVDFIHANGMRNYNGVFPVPEEYKSHYPTNLEEKTAEICETYGLSAHSSAQEIYDYAEACQAAGAGDFVLDPNDSSPATGGFYDMKLYEDGSFTMNHGFLYYIRKGSLCTDSQYVAYWLDLPAYETSWQYETASGAVVCCATGAGQASLVLYETPQAWVLVLGGDHDTPPYALEAIADCYDFAQLP